MMWKDHAFTLVELLIAIVVIAILAAISVSAYNGVQIRAVDSEKASKMQTIVTAIENYKTINGTYPAHDIIFGTIGATTLELPLKTLEPTGYNHPIRGIDGGTANNTTTGYRYFAIGKRASDGAVVGCGDSTTVCSYFSLTYWSYRTNSVVTRTGGTYPT